MTLRYLCKILMAYFTLRLQRLCWPYVSNASPSHEKNFEMFYIESVSEIGIPIFTLR